MTNERIASAVKAASRHLRAHPEDGTGTDAFARAVLDAGLRMRIEGPSGQTARTDMPASIGGEASAPSPGWLLRAGVASCTATVIALRAAALGITLDRLEVNVVSQSDDRGMLGTDDSVPAGFLNARMEIRLAAAGIDPKTLEALASWGTAHSPMADALCRAVPLETVIAVG
jgi:uncharacterized OsmC-like protein